MAGSIVLVFVGFSWAGALFLRPILRLFVRTHLGAVNDLVGYVLPCYGVFYGLLLGLLAVAAYQNYSQVDHAVTREATSLATLYRYVSDYPEPHADVLQADLREYCRYQIEDAWPQQNRGIVPEGGRARLTSFLDYLLAVEPTSAAEQVLLGECIEEFSRLSELRRDRLHSLSAGIPLTMWYVVAIGAVINIALVWLFEMRLITHLFLGGLLAFFLAGEKRMRVYEGTGRLLLSATPNWRLRITQNADPGNSPLARMT